LTTEAKTPYVIRITETIDQSTVECGIVGPFATEEEAIFFTNEQLTAAHVDAGGDSIYQYEMSQLIAPWEAPISDVPAEEVTR